MRQRGLFILIVLIFLGGLTAIVLRAGLNNSGQAARRSSSSQPSLSARESKPASSISVDRPRTSPAPRASKAYTQYRTEGLAVHSVTEGLGAYWVGTTGGVIRYRKDTKVATIFDNTSGLWSNLVRHVRIDPALGVVVGTFGGGLSLFDPAHQTWRHLSIADGLPDTFVQWTLRSRAGDLWIATWSGVCLVRNGVVDDLRSWTCYDVVSTAGGLPSDRIYALAEDDSGSIWAATDSGIARFRSGVWRGWTHADGLGAEISAKALAAETTPGRKRDIGATALGRNRHPEADSYLQRFPLDRAVFNPNVVTSIFIDGEDRVWAGTWGGGLALYQNGLWRNYTIADGLAANHVHGIARDRDGRILVATSGGLSIYRGGNFQSLTTKDGLLSNAALTVVVGADGGFWVGGVGGAVHFPKLPEIRPSNG